MNALQTFCFLDRWQDVEYSCLTEVSRSQIDMDELFIPSDEREQLFLDCRLGC